MTIGMGRRLALLALVLSIVAAGYLVFAPLYETSTLAGNSAIVSTGRATLLQVNGWTALIPVLIPVLICGVVVYRTRTLPARGAPAVGAALLSVLVVLGGFSIGMFYAPSAVTMLLAALPRT
jgi:hypothetical protein